MDKLVEDGAMTAWGWMRHHTGGEWRRIRWFGAESIQGALDGLDAMGEALEAAGEESESEPSDACPHHDDYIWAVESRSDTEERGAVGMSVYYSCKITDEARADEIFDELFAPVLNEYVGEGKLGALEAAKKTTFVVVIVVQHRRRYIQCLKGLCHRCNLVFD